MSKFKKTYNFPSTPSPTSKSRGIIKVRGFKHGVERVEDTMSVEQLKHLQACIHYTHTHLADEAAKRIDSSKIVKEFDL